LSAPAWWLLGAALIQQPQQPALAAAPPPAPRDSTPPEAYYGVTEWREPQTQNLVTLVPMIHMADAAFYDEVARIARGADVTLTEGVGGAPTLSPTTFFLTYLFESYPRARFFGGLVAQNEGLGALRNARNADATWAQYLDATPWWTPLVHLVALPVAVVLLEPLEFGLERNHLLIANNGFAEPAPVSESVPKIKMSLQKIGAKHKRLLVAGDSFVQLALIFQGIPKIEAGFFKFGLEGERALVTSDGLVQFALVLESTSQVIVRRRQVRFECKQFSEASNGLLQLALRYEGDTQA